MSALSVFFLAALSLVFLVWIIYAVRILARLTRTSGGRMFDFGDGFLAGIGRNLAAYRAILIAPEYRADRRMLLLLTALLFGVILARVILLT